MDPAPRTCTGKMPEGDGGALESEDTDAQFIFVGACTIGQRGGDCASLQMACRRCRHSRGWCLSSAPCLLLGFRFRRGSCRSCSSVGHLLPKKASSAGHLLPLKASDTLHSFHSSALPTAKRKKAKIKEVLLQAYSPLPVTVVNFPPFLLSLPLCDVFGGPVTNPPLHGGVWSV